MNKSIPSAALILLLALVPVHAQTAPSTQSKEVAEQSTVIWISAQNKDGTPAELTPSDLEVKVDGKRTAVSGLRKPNPLLNYCLLLDNSGSTRPALKGQYANAVALLSKIPHAGRDYGVLVDFNDEAYVDAEGTDPQHLIKGIKQAARGGTALFDTMVACSDDLSKGEWSKGAPDALRLMFVLSDGEDNASHLNRQAAERTLLKARIRVYSIGQTSGANSTAELRAKGDKSLKGFAELTGGKTYLPGKNMNLERIVADISSDLAGLYSMTLASDNSAGDRVHKLEVKCSKKDVALSAPREYYVPLP
jgi:Ca-activated chloride channel homolog